MCRASLVAQLVKKIHLLIQETWVQSLVGKVPWRRERLPTPVFWPGELCGLYSPWACRESDATERLSFHILQWLCALGIFYYTNFSVWHLPQRAEINNPTLPWNFESWNYLGTSKGVTSEMEELGVVCSGASAAEQIPQSLGLFLTFSWFHIAYNSHQWETNLINIKASYKDNKHLWDG